MYSLKQIKKNYNGRNVVDIEKLDIESGITYALSGPNGAGKTTLLNILSFLLIPSSGHFSFFNAPVVFNEKNLRQLRKSVILVDQHPILFSTSVYKNIEFGLKVRKIPKNKRNGIIASSLEMVDMAAFTDTDARTLSGGETRRIAIARALACSPDVLLLDEPTADLDIESRLTMENIVREIRDQKKITVIFCTHDLSQASRLTDKKIILVNGRLQDIYHENIFKGDVLSPNPDEYYCRINENILIPVPSTDKNKIKISIHPGMIHVVGRKKTAPGISFSHKGRITHLGMEKDKIRAVIDIGTPITVLMEKSDYDSNGFRINDAVDIDFNRNGIKILG